MKLKSFLKIYFAGLIALLIIINACSVKKRVYRSGYNVEWIGSKKAAAKRELTDNLRVNKTPKIEISNPLAEPITASNSISSSGSEILFLSEKSANEKINFLSKHTDSKIIEGCDTIVFKNGLKIKAKVLEVGAQEIKYKMCDNLDGPTFIKNTADVSFISHANGTFTDVTEINAPGPSNNQSTNQNTSRTTSNGTDGKSQLVALLLCGFLGAFGIHRFYLGHIGIGVLMLLTGGCCGILWVVDFVRIITGDLKPKDGDYTEKF